ncbi:unnamed protein product [Malassezia sympodialis ATCC 42132]|uniref:Similar to S.cerevisiae protein MPO1 (Protein involved in metabolism of phytosphingosine) n=1 Tax=Malassezia sympodialis (strain ATCC 42132) TaxID=1230383 RepID=M5E6R2_MALS4|nr:uncharacterized protein MSY001_1106 [Malassezia sympodialis ATCC 42132]CCU98400.1 unnamed protein product [Malassezia sympodialis ATCC 42132]SHO75776.1 Similar to S.cerevisiae protein MPO1 (Protein involved in metabolism of phytosphingosine) [Malassezia sympodialis ATCC 42132]|eukprot:XP_018739707.1 uncharacterized protein MSY001_1106 [Malassezia sympodialis ATCC 42132]
MPLSASPLSFRDQLAFYGAYHTNRVNVGIHMVCVPLIYMSSLALVLAAGVSLESVAARLPPPIGARVWDVCQQLAIHVPPAVWPHLNFASLVAALYLAYYFVLDVASAVLLTPLWVAYYAVAWLAMERVEHAATYAGILFVTSWLLQFYGHGVHEGRAPALLDNLLGALVLAPLFVFVETLFLFGYRPELQAWLKNETGRLLVQFRAQHPRKAQ